MQNRFLGHWGIHGMVWELRLRGQRAGVRAIGFLGALLCAFFAGVAGGAEAPVAQDALLSAIVAFQEGSGGLNLLVRDELPDGSFSDAVLEAAERRFACLLEEQREDWGTSKISGWLLCRVLAAGHRDSSLPLLVRGLRHPDDRYRYYSAQAISQSTKWFVCVSCEAVLDQMPSEQDVQTVAEQVAVWMQQSRK